jgi:hypothetical protein
LPIDQSVAKAHKRHGAFTASETFDVGVDLGSPVSLGYLDRAALKYDANVGKVIVEVNYFAGRCSLSSRRMP